MPLSSISQATLQSGNADLQAYVRGGFYLGAGAVEEFTILEQTVSSAANTSYFWQLPNLGFDFRPLALWAYYPTTPSGTITFNVKQPPATIFSVTINGTAAAAGYNFPIIGIRSLYTIEMICSVAFTRMVVVGKACKVLEAIPATLT